MECNEHCTGTYGTSTKVRYVGPDLTVAFACDGTGPAHRLPCPLEVLDALRQAREWLQPFLPENAAARHTAEWIDKVLRKYS